MSSTVRNVIMAVIVVICLALVIVGQKNIGVPGLIMEVVGLIGLLTVLFFYNRRFK